MPRYRERKQVLNYLANLNKERAKEAFLRRKRKYIHDSSSENSLNESNSSDSSKSNSSELDDIFLLEDIIDRNYILLEKKIKDQRYLKGGKYRKKSVLTGKMLFLSKAKDSMMKSFFSNFVCKDQAF